MKPATFDEAIHKWCKDRLSARPAYYSGRGPNAGDLNSDHLEMIYKGIESDVDTEINKEASRSFIKLVYNLKDLSATNFLVEFRNLFNRGFKYEKPVEDKLAGAIESHGEARDNEAMFFLMAVMTNKQTQGQADAVSFMIKSKFLTAHQIPLDDLPKPANNLYPLGYGPNIACDE